MAEILNKGQRQAVEAIEGPVMVIAGPGTGKTTVLTLRIAKILEMTDTPPDGILALTFTESAVVNMRRKLVELIGPRAYRVGIYTFHGFAEEVIRRYPESFPLIIGGMIATEAEKLSIIEKILDEKNFEYIKPFGAPYHYVSGILHTISDLKRDNIDPAGFLLVLEREEKDLLNHPDLYHEKGKHKGEMKTVYKDALKGNKKNRELALVYTQYEKRLAEAGLYDFDDMLLELIRALERESDLLQALQEEFLYFLADEHQDANNAQNKILELLSSYFDEPNLFIVGDEKQAIYRFQGASLENFLYFKNKFPTAKLIYLDENFRSHQNILDVSHALAESLPGDPAGKSSTSNGAGKSLRPRLLQRSERSDGLIKVIAFKTERDECEGILDDIERLIAGGAHPKEIAVLVRTNREITDLGRSLLARGIPANLYQDEDVLEDREIQKLLLLLRYLADPTDEKLLGEALFIDFLNLHPVKVTKLLRHAYYERTPLLDLLPEVDKQFADKLARWMQAARNQSALEALTTVISEAGFTEHLLKQPESVQKISLLSALYQELALRQAHERTMTIKDFLGELDTIALHGGRMSFSTRLPRENAVAVMTVHKAKGQEWDTVFLPHAVDGVWGNKRAPSLFRLPYPLGSAHQSGKEEDERRLFYVALTRARERLIITHSHIRADGRESVLSRFVEELPDSLIKTETGKAAPDGAEVLKAVAKKESKERTIWDRDYLRKEFFEQGLGATSLNNYLECPWKYFFLNLICIPDVPTKAHMYGTAMHDALAFITNSKRERREIKLEDVYERFEKCLHRQPLPQRDFKEALVRGKKALKALWATYAKSWHANSYAEFVIKGVFVPIGGVDRVPLRGRLDKIEIFDDGEVRVIDYKTGKKSEKDKRQLDFYRLLLDLYESKKYDMTRGAVIYTEPDDKGRIREEEYEMSKADAERVEEEIVRVSHEILNFDFWDKTCDDKDCEYCRLRNVLLT